MSVSQAACDYGGVEAFQDDLTERCARRDHGGRNRHPRYFLIAVLPSSLRDEDSDRLVGRIPRGGLVDRKQRPDIGAAAPASLTGELRLRDRTAYIIRPLARVDRGRMGAAIVSAVDQPTTRARRGGLCYLRRLRSHASLISKTKIVTMVVTKIGPATIATSVSNFSGAAGGRKRKAIPAYEKLSPPAGLGE
jgi:hypothetical protein